MDDPYINSFVLEETRRYILTLTGKYEQLAPVAGDVPACLRRLLYLQRTHPSAHDIMLGIGLCRLVTGDPRASEALEFLAGAVISPVARFFLLMARIRAGAYDNAFVEMKSLLRETAVLHFDIFHRLCNMVVKAVRCNGWCGMLPDGKIVVGVRAKRQPSITIRAGGDEIAASVSLLTDQGEYTVWQVDNVTLPHALCPVHVHYKGRQLVGSGLECRSIWQFQGFVEECAEGISGWCRYPNNIGAENRLVVRSGLTDMVICEKVFGVEDTDQLCPEKRRTEFCITWADLAHSGTGPVRITDPFGQDLYGSPLTPQAGAHYARNQAEQVAMAFPAACPPEAPAHSVLPYPALYTSRFSAHRGKGVRDPAVNPVVIVIPVYKGLKVTKECLSLALKWREADTRIVAVNDCSPDPAIVAYLESLDGCEGIQVLHNERNRGFTYTANRGLREAGRDEDVILLNSDTLLPKGWVSRLRETAYSAPDIGTATPLSNAATIFSYPRNDGQNTIPRYDEVEEMAALLAGLGHTDTVDVPTAHGFCMYIRAECLRQTGVLREDVFAQGYGEENDFSRRALALGWRHVVCLNTFVGHVEGQSFSAFRGDLMRRNLRILNGLHPGYDAVVQAWQKKDPLGPFRRLVDMTRLTADLRGRTTVALVTHNRGGGVQKFVRRRAAQITDEGKLALVISPLTAGEKGKPPRWHVVPATLEDYPNILCDTDGDALQDILLALHCERIEMHSYIGAGVAAIGCVARFGIPYNVYLHDYSWFCPRITLVSYNNIYCGEQSEEACGRCVRDLGALNEDDLTADELREQSRDILNDATEIIASCRDVAARYRRQMGVSPIIHQWEAPTANEQIAFRPKSDSEVRRILLIGAIGMEKGYNVILKLARYVVETGLPLRFVIVGFTCDDERLLETGVVEITGPYGDDELPALISEQSCDWGFLPAQWPETWSYVLTEFWRQKIPVVTFDIGAPAQRVRECGGGMVIPLHLRMPELAALLMDPAVFSYG